jgi:hypothetical protein
MPLFAPSVEIRIATTTSDAPVAPMVTFAASEATSADPAIPVGDRDVHIGDAGERVERDDDDGREDDRARKVVLVDDSLPT